VSTTTHPDFIVLSGSEEYRYGLIIVKFLLCNTPRIGTPVVLRRPGTPEKNAYFLKIFPKSRRFIVDILYN
jgi:hypothetical protein